MEVMVLMMRFPFAACFFRFCVYYVNSEFCKAWVVLNQNVSYQVSSHSEAVKMKSQLGFHNLENFLFKCISFGTKKKKKNLLYIYFLKCVLKSWHCNTWPGFNFRLMASNVYSIYFFFFKASNYFYNLIMTSLHKLVSSHIQYGSCMQCTFNKNY